MAPISKKEKVKVEKMKQSMMKRIIEREIQEMEREPLPGEVEAIMKRTTKEDRLSKFSSQRLNRICTTDPQTDSPRVLNFLNKLCKLR